MLRARFLLIAAVAGATAGPAVSVVVPTQPTATFSAIPRAEASTPTTLREVFATMTEVPVTTTTTAPPAPPKRKQPVGDSKDDHNKVDTRPTPKAAGLPLGSPFIGKYVGTEIEGFARYEGQSTCDPTPKAGTLALRDLLLSRYPSTKSLGVSRSCDVGGQSEHKEGRAFDWGADVTNAADVAAVNDFLDALFATDAAGHKHALARRMGIMYVIWNQKIWGAYDMTAGWRTYEGDNPHTDHVHISLSWAGGRGQTSYWSGSIVAGLPDGLPRPPRTTTTRPPRTTTTRPPRSTTTTRPPRSTTTTSVPQSTTTTLDDSSPTTSPSSTTTTTRRRRG